MEQQQLKKCPIGIQTFDKLREGNFLYVDKTAMIYQIASTSTPYFLSRPRRFGKSLFLSMLYSYYDCNQKECFEKLFGNLWIGQHPTSLQGIYQVLFLDFSQITGKIEVLEERFNAFIRLSCSSRAGSWQG